MKVLQIVDKLNSGGAERMCTVIASILNNAGIDVSILELLDAGELGAGLSKKINIIQLHRKSRLDPQALLALVKEMRKYDIIHVHMRHVFRYVFLVNLFVGREIVFHDHTNLFPESVGKRILFKILFRKIKYVSVGESGVNWAIEKLKLNPRKVFMLPNVIFRNNTANNYTPNSIVFVSNIRSEKNIEFIVPFLSKLLTMNRDVKMDVVGKISDVPYYNYILDLIEKAGLTNHVVFRSNMNDVQSILGNYTLGVHFSKRESGPLVLLEYLAHNLPFLSFYTGEVSKKLAVDLPDYFLYEFNPDIWALKASNLMSEKKNHDEIFKRYNNTDIYLRKCLTIYQSIAS